MTTAPRTVTLTRPIERQGAEPITELRVVEPSVGALRGVKLVELLRLDVATLQTVLPRIVQPLIGPDDVAALAPVDFFALGAATLGFFMSEADVQEAMAAQVGA